MEPMPGTHTIADLVGEMVLHVEVPAHRADFVTEMLSCQGNILDVDTMRNNLNCHQFEALARLAQLSDQQIGQTKLLLGTVLNPFMFNLAQEAPPLPLPTSTPGVENGGSHNANGGKRKKGGSKLNISEVLAPRRKAPSEYFPPAAFDIHRIGSAKRNENGIRLLIPLEVCHVIESHSPHHTSLTSSPLLLLLLPLPPSPPLVSSS